jgi:hypothetical protein
MGLEGGQEASRPAMNRAISKDTPKWIINTTHSRRTHTISRQQAHLGECYDRFMKDDSDKPPVVSLAAARAERDRDFSQERADILRELEEIEVAPDQLASITQHVMFVEWLIFKSVLMFDYHNLERDPRAIVELAKLMASPKSR